MSRDKLTGKNLDSASLSGEDMSESNLSHTSLRYSQLKGTRLHNADLSDSDMHGANLRRADVSGANLTNVDLSDADVHGVDLGSAASLQGANLDGTRGMTGDLNLRVHGDDSLSSTQDGKRAARESVQYLIAAVAELNGEIAMIAGALGVHYRSSSVAIAATESPDLPSVEAIHRFRRRRDELETQLIHVLTAETDAPRGLTVSDDQAQDNPEV